jgi:hydroxymethylpyrimidine kinase/phosphomethylpyrimidine kinase
LKAVLTIAGFDASNGAGITKDLEVFSSLGLNGLSVPTSFVLQGPKGTRTITAVSTQLFSQMLRDSEEGFNIAGIKIGVLPEAEHVNLVVDFLAARRSAFVVLDPVRAAKNGVKLMTDGAMAAIERRLLPHVTCITPNLDEAEALLGRRIDGLTDMEWAARELVHRGAKNAVVKGGHLAGKPVDLLFDGRRIVTHDKNRVNKEVHGTGCLFSSSLLSFLAMDYPMAEAFLATEWTMERFLDESRQPAEGGYFYAFPAAVTARDGEKWQVLQAMHMAAERLRTLDVAELIPAVQMNLCYALRAAHDTQDVATFPGRIGQHAGKICFRGMPEFSASSDVARFCLACMKHYPHLRAGMSIRYNETTIAKARNCGMTVIFRGRTKERDDLERPEDKGLDPLVDAALSEARTPPDIICDLGNIGKEPIIGLFARNPRELITKLEMIRP